LHNSSKIKTIDTLVSATAHHVVSVPGITPLRIELQTDYKTQATPVIVVTEKRLRELGNKPANSP
jgi:hypothetical protein